MYVLTIFFVFTGDLCIIGVNRYIILCNYLCVKAKICIFAHEKGRICAGYGYQYFRENAEWRRFSFCVPVSMAHGGGR